MEEEKKHKKLKGWQIVLIVMGALMEFLALLASIENRDPEMFLAWTFMLGFLGGIAWTIVNAVKRRKVANPLIVTAVCFCAFIAAALIFSDGETPPEQPGKPAVEEPTKVEEPKQSDEEKPCEHKWVLVDSVAATEESEGYEEYKCESCGEKDIKKTPKLEHVVTFEEVYRAYKENELAADEKYKGNRYKVTGQITGLSSSGLLNLTGGATLTMQTNVGGTIVIYIAEFEKDQEDALKQIKVGDTITLEGTCGSSGYWYDCELVG